MNRCIHHKLTLLVFMAVCAFSSALLASCSNGNKETIPVVGEFDSTAIAADTTMQLGFESSYEFHKTLAVHEKLVYDVVG